MSFIFKYKLALLPAFITVLLFSDLGFADTGKVKMRARENYEFIKVETAEGQSKFEGFSHTFNLWYEIPTKWAFGLAFGPFAVDYGKVSESTDEETIGNDIKLFNTGIEFKRWHDSGLFARVGTYRQIFNGNAPSGKDIGYANLVGIGYEHSFDGWGLALEADYRRSFLVHKKWNVDAQLIAIGVHFYEWL